MRQGMAQELKEAGAQLRTKIFAPAATQTEFGQIANLVDEYDYDSHFETYLTSRQAAGLLLDLYDSDDTVRLVDRETLSPLKTRP